MGNNSVPKIIFRLSRFPLYRGSVLGRFYCICICMCIYIYIYLYTTDNSTLITTLPREILVHSRCSLPSCSSTSQHFNVHIDDFHFIILLQIFEVLITNFVKFSTLISVYITAHSTSTAILM